jgi:hypothetical protein
MRAVCEGCTHRQAVDSHCSLDDNRIAIRLSCGCILLCLMSPSPYGGMQAAGGSGKSVPPSVLLMQQNTRLVILTLEVLAEGGARLQLPDPPQQPAQRQDSSAQPPQRSQQPQQPQPELRADTESEQPAVGPAAGDAASGHADSEAAAGGNLDPVGYVAAFPAGGGAPASPRPAAVRLLVCYMGAMLRSRASAAAFVDGAAACYRWAGQGAGDF